MRISDWSSDVCSSDLIISAARDADGCTRLHRRCSDLLVTQPTEQFTKAGYFLVLHLGQGFGGNVAAGHARAAGRNDAVNLRIVDPAVEPGDDLFLVVLFQIAGSKDVTCSLYLFDQNVPGTDRKSVVKGKRVLVSEELG